MRSKPFYWVGAMALIALVLYSCQKDEISETNPTTTDNPITLHEEPEMDITIGESPNDGTPQPVIGLKEIRETMKAKSLLVEIFKATFVQLIINHNFNPAFPALDYRTPCTCPGLGPGGTDITDCDCPAQTNSPASGAYPQTVTLTYCTTSCAPCTLAPSGLVVSGNIDIVFSAPFTDPNHTISIQPQDNFMIDGYGVEASNIEIHYDTNTDPVTSEYLFEEISNLQITDPSGAVTTLNQPSGSFSSSTLTIMDVNGNHGVLTAPAFGLLDDLFLIDIIKDDAIPVTCSNGQTVHQYTDPDGSLFYDMNCDCIQFGTVHTLGPNPIDPSEEVILTSVHYGYDGSTPIVYGGMPGVCPGVCGFACDSHILVETHCYTLTAHDPNSAVVRASCASTYEPIDCL